MPMPLMYEEMFVQLMSTATHFSHLPASTGRMIVTTHG